MWEQKWEQKLEQEWEQEWEARIVVDHMMGTRVSKCGTVVSGQFRFGLKIEQKQRCFDMYTQKQTWTL